MKNMRTNLKENERELALTQEISSLERNGYDGKYCDELRDELREIQDRRFLKELKDKLKKEKKDLLAKKKPTLKSTLKRGTKSPRKKAGKEM